MDLQEIIRKGEHEIKPLLHYLRGDNLNLLISVLKVDEKLIKKMTEFQTWENDVFIFVNENCKEKRNEIEDLFKSLQDNDFNASDFGHIIEFLRSFNDSIKKEITIQEINKQSNTVNKVPKVFVGYGRSKQEVGLIQEIEKYIQKLGFYLLTPLHIRLDPSKSFQELFFEMVTSMDFAIFVFLGSSDLSRNLIMELAYTISKLGPERVCLLVDEDFKMPFDISMVRYFQINNNGQWLLMVAKDMKNLGFDIDLNKLLE